MATHLALKTAPGYICCYPLCPDEEAEQEVHSGTCLSSESEPRSWDSDPARQALGPHLSTEKNDRSIEMNV